MRFVVASVIAYLSSNVASTYAEDAKSAVFIRHQSTLFSDAVPIKAFEDDLRGIDPPKAGRHALAFNKLEAGVAYRGVEIAHFLREDYVFEFSADTMELVYRDKNKIPIPDGKVYDVYLKVQHIKTEGWRMGYNLAFLKNSNLRMSFNYFDAEDLLYGSLEGQVTVDDGDINGGNLAVLYYYHEEYLLNRKRIQTAKGGGYSFDVEMDLRLDAGWRIQLDLNDLLGRIHWDSAPYTQADIASTSTYYDSDGYARREPMMVGIESYQNLTQHLPVHYQLSVSKDIAGRFGAVYAREKYDDVEFDRAFLQYRITDQLHFLGGYDFTMEAVWIALQSDALSLAIGTDDWSLAESNALVLRFAGRLSF